MLATYMQRVRNNNLKIIGSRAPFVARINTTRSNDVIFLRSFFANENCFAVNALFFSQVLESVDVWESLSAKQSGGR